MWRQHSGWQRSSLTLPEPPSSYYYRNVFMCFFRDRVGIKLLDDVGEDNITFESDFPHTDSTWPNSAQVAADCLQGLTENQIRKIVRGNAIRMLSLPPDPA